MSEWSACQKCGSMRENQCACENPDCPDFIRHNLKVPTTGNREQDEAILRRATVHEDLIDKGLCPNNDGGKLVEIEPGTQKCPVCNYTQFNRTL